MKNKIKMLIFKDTNSKLKSNITRALPEEVEIYNTLVLSYKDENNKLHFDMTYVLPNSNELAKPASFDVLFLTGEYSGLFLENIKPLNINLRGFVQTDIEENTEATIIPAKLINNPEAYNNNFYYFKVGQYSSTTLDVHAVMNIYDRIRQDNKMTIKEVQELISKVNSESFLAECELNI